MTLWIVLGGLGLALCLAMLPGRSADRQDPRAFFAARGQFGAVLFFLVSVGETYSIGSLLGFPGGIAATRTVDVALWFIGYILLACPVGYWLYPRLWAAGQRTGAITLPDLVKGWFCNVPLERATALLLVVLMVPLGAMQFIGLNGVVAQMGLPLPVLPMALFCAGIAFAFVAMTGLRATARISLLKDVLIMIAVLTLAVAVCAAWPGDRAMPLRDVFHTPPAGKGAGTLFVISTIVMQAMGFCIAPQTVAAAFSARSPQVIRKAQIWLPLYMGLFPLLGVIAVFGIMNPGTSAAGDRIFLAVASLLLPGWALGMVYCAVVLTALVWLGGMGLSLSAIVTRNLIPAVPARLQSRVGLVVILVYFVCSVLIAIRPHTLIVTLNQFFYLGLVQLLPAVLVCVEALPVRSRAILAGLIAGLASGVGLALSGWLAGGVHPALPAVAINVAIAVLWNAVEKRMGKAPAHIARENRL